MLPSLNTGARKFTKVKPNYTVDALKNSQLKVDLGKNLDLYNRIWQEIKIGS
jgi:spermidine/putrescine transport system substrate-binding protein